MNWLGMLGAQIYNIPVGAEEVYGNKGWEVESLEMREHTHASSWTWQPSPPGLGLHPGPMDSGSST